ncbi:MULTISPECIES: hypothetical protein [unclassified Shewanella]|uniref:hypothetical protein n=1 Tax=unclassified Shewanella TaxID=196818 RepID=UPI001F056336|nr:MULTISPECIES: hypothetical protein [unclassified Shewanella]
MGIFNWVKQLFAIKATTRSQATDLQALFGGEATASLTVPRHQAYPLVTPTTETELSAYQLHCLLNDQDKQRLDTLLCQAGFEQIVGSDAPFNGVLHHTPTYRQQYFYSNMQILRGSAYCSSPMISIYCNSLLPLRPRRLLLGKVFPMLILIHLGVCKGTLSFGAMRFGAPIGYHLVKPSACNIRQTGVNSVSFTKRFM